MRGGQADSVNPAELSIRKISSVLHYCALLFVVALAPVVLSGCSGLVSSASTTGNPPPPPTPSALNITNVQVTSATTSTSQIVWTTNVAADSAVDYGASTSYGSSTPVDSAMVMSHQVTLTGLAASTTYYYQVRSSDLKNNHANSGGHTLKTAGFNISGTINPTTGGSGATLTLSGAASTTTTADSLGNYTFAGLANGTYTIAPSHAGFTFTPSSQSMAVNGANVIGVNFTDTAQTFNISGTISPTAGGSGTTVMLSGAASAATTADGLGAYAFTGLARGSYTITPNNTGYTFTPVSQNVTVSTVNVAGVNFTGNAAPVAPTITTQPTNQTVTAGQTASFAVVATGTAPLSYQWQKNGVNIAGATSVSYTTPVTTTSDSGSTFAAVVSNTAGTVTSAAATLTVNPTAMSAIQVSPTSINFGNAVVGSTLSQPVTITNTGTATLTITQVTESGAGFTVSGFSLPLSVSVGQGATITVAYLPTSIGAASGSIAIVSNASNSPSIVSLSGTGTTSGGAGSALAPLCGAADDGLTHMPSDWGTKTAPSEGGNYVDGLASAISSGATGCTVYRVTNSTLDLPETGGAGTHCWTSNEYNAVASAFNANDQFLTLYNPSGNCGTSHYYIKNISNLSSPSMQIDTNHMPSDANGDAGIIWDPSNANVFYYVNQGNVLKSATITGVNTLTTATVHTFSEYASIDIMNYSQRTPIGFIVSLVGQQPTTNVLEIFSYDMNKSSKVDDVVTPCTQAGMLGPQPGGNCLHKLQITAEGHLIIDYVNASPAASFQGQMITNGTSQNFIWPGNLAAHHTTGMANDGLTSMYVSVDDPGGQLSRNPCSHNLGIVWMNVANMLGNSSPPATENCLFSYFWAQGGTITWVGSSGTNPWMLASTLDTSSAGLQGPTYFNNNPSYAAPTTPCPFANNNCAPSGAWTTYDNELILIPSDCVGSTTGAGCTAGPSGRKAYRLGWCNTRASENFWDVCKASISADGRYIVFTQTLAYNQNGCPATIDSGGAAVCPDAYVIGPLF